MTCAKETAAGTYEKRRKDVAVIIDCIQMELKKHAAQAKEEPANWGCAGDLGHVREQLKQVLMFLTNMDSEEAADRFIENHLKDMREV